jgi:hypothetical protein
MEPTMKNLSSAMILLLLSSSVTFAQNNAGAMRSAASNRPERPFTPPSNQAIVSHDGFMIPNNLQSFSNPSNPQDLTRSGASNPQDLLGR